MTATDDELRRLAEAARNANAALAADDDNVELEIAGVLADCALIAAARAETRP
jgi:hypothetical protein